MRILFIGNSYTYYNDLPDLFQTLCRENGLDVSCASVTFGGRKLFEHTIRGDEAALKLEELAQEEWDAVFLQEHSLLAITDYPLFKSGIEAILSKLGGRAKRVILYETWARHQKSETLRRYQWTQEEMSTLITRGYGAAAEELGLEVSPVGQSFLKIGQERPDLMLYHEDLTHPSPLGSSIAALVHYRTLFSTLPGKVDSLSPEAAALGAILG